MNWINIRTVLDLYILKKKMKGSFRDLLYRDLAPLIFYLEFEVPTT